MPVYWVTPSLAVTDGGTRDVDAALALIETGGDAHVADVEVAEIVLTQLGLSAAEIADKVRFAFGSAR
jgi:hypothetical protein